MFSNNLFYQSILLIVYFDNDIDIIECSLLSRAKNPIDIITEGAKTAVAPVYIELPGTLQRFIPTQTAASVTRGHAAATNTFAVPEYIIYHNEAVHTSSPSVNLYRYEADKPSVDQTEYLNRYEPKRITIDTENINYYDPVTRSTIIYGFEPARTIADTSIFNQYRVSRTFLDTEKIRYEPLQTVTNLKKVDNYGVTKRNKFQPLEYKNINQYQPLRTLFDNVDEYKPGRTFTDVGKVNQFQPLRTSLHNVVQYKPARTFPAIDNVNQPMNTSLNYVDQYKLARTFSDVENVNQYQLLRTSLDYVDQYKPARTSSDVENVNQYQPLRTSLDYVDQYKPARTSSDVENVNQYQLLRTSLDYVDQYKPARTSSDVENVNQYQPLRTSLDYVDHYKPARTSSDVENVNQYQPLRTSLDYVDQYKPARTSSDVENVNQYQPLRTSLDYVDQYKPARTSSDVNNVNQYQLLRTSLDYVDQYKPARTSSGVENVNPYQLLRTSLDYVDQYKPARTSSGVENVNQYQPLRTSLDNFEQYKPVRSSPASKNVNQYKPFRSSSENVDQYEPARTSSGVENVNQYELLRTSLDYIDQYKPARTSSDVENVNQYQPLRTSLDNFEQYKPVRSSLASDNVNQYKPFRSSLENVDQYEPVGSFSVIENFNQYKPLIPIDSVDQYKPVKTLSVVENVNQYHLLRTSLNYDDQYKTDRTSAVPENDNQPLRTSLNSVDEFKPGRTFSVLKNSYQYQPLRTSLDNVYQYKPARILSATEHVYRYEPLRTSSDNVDQYKPDRNFLPSKNINYYEPVRSSPPSEEFYRYEPLRTSALPLPNQNVQGHENRVVPVGTYQSVDNIYRYELERVSSPVKVYPYFPVRTTILKKSRLSPDVYRFEPMRTSTSSEYFDPHEPIKFSALYIDQPSRTTKITSSLANRNDAAIMVSQNPQRTVSLKKYDHRLDHLRSTNEVLLSRFPLITNVQKATYQFTPFILNWPPESVVKSKNKYQFTPYLTLETSTSSFNQKEFVNRTKSPDEYWNEFIRANPDRTLSNLYQTQYLTPAHTTRNVYKADLNTVGVEGNVYPDLPFETSRAPEEYWNEFIRNDPRGTHKVKKPLRTSQVLYEDESMVLSKFSEILNQTSPNTNSYQYLPSETITTEAIFQPEPHRTSRQQNYIYQNVLQTSNSPQIEYKHEFQSSPQLGGNHNLLGFTTSSLYYKNLPTRTFVPHADIFQRGSTGSSTVGDYILRNRPNRTSPQPQTFSRYEPSGNSRSSENVYQNEISITNTPVHKAYPERHEQPAKTIYPYQSSQVATTSQSSDPPRQRQGFKTLWQPTTMTSKSTKRPSHTEYNFKPSRTTRVFNWNFNDVDAAWPKVELIFSTTESTTAATKPKRKFPTYFPFYLRTIKEEKRTYSSLKKITTQSKTTIKVAKTADSIDADHKLMLDFIQRQNTKKKNVTQIHCYSCGLNLTDIPYYPSCYHVFDNPGSIYSINKNKYKVNCRKQSSRRKLTDYWVAGNRTLYRDGCFKRFVEFGEVYSERGCRTLEPLQGKSIISFRLAAMERMLKDVDEGCLVSPHASLTPFARGISLFARYHVCVCQGKYCNAAEMLSSSIVMTIFNIFLRI